MSTSGNVIEKHYQRGGINEMDRFIEVITESGMEKRRVVEINPPGSGRPPGVPECRPGETWFVTAEGMITIVKERVQR